MYESVKKNDIYMDGSQIGITNGENYVDYAYGMPDTLSVNLVSNNILAPVGSDLN